MLARLESFARRSAHALRWRIRSDKFWIFCLELLELLHHAIELDVGNFRFVQHEVEVFVAAQLLAELFDLFGFVRVLRHVASTIRENGIFSIQCATQPRNTVYVCG